MTVLANYRNLENYPRRNGKLTGQKLLRSAYPFAFIEHKDEILKAFKKQNLKHIIDLRNQNELNQNDYQQYLPTNIQYHHLPFLNPDFEKECWQQSDPFVQLYGQYLLDKRNHSNIRAILEAFSEAKGKSALFHCSAGKDRTGSTAAFLMTIVGCNLDDIKSEFMKSNENKHQVYEVAKRLFDTQMLPEDPMWGVKVHWLELLIKPLYEYHSPKDYFKDHGIISEKTHRTILEYYSQIDH